VRLEECGDLLDVHQTGLVLGVGDAKVRELCRRRVLPSLKPGRALKIPREGIRRYIDAALSCQSLPQGGGDE